jgi:DNA-directed RNA polymerase specialized sigma24 family protein
MIRNSRCRKRDRSELVRRALMRLSIEHREIIDLVYYHEKSVEEVAHILDIPPATVKTRMFYARKKLRRNVARARHGEPPPPSFFPQTLQVGPFIAEYSDRDR